MRRHFTKCCLILALATLGVLSTTAQPARPQPLSAEFQKRREAGSAFQLGRIYLRQRNQAKYPLAITNFQKAAKVYNDLGDTANAACALLGIGAVEALQGKTVVAAETYNRALALLHSLNDAPDESALAKLGFIYDELVGKRTLFPYDDLSIQPPKRGIDQNGERVDTRFSQLDHRYAIQFFNQPFILYVYADERPAFDDPRFAGAGDARRKISFYKDVAAIWKLNGAQSLEVATGVNLMEAWAKQNPQVAVFYGKRAVNEYQELRRGIKQARPYDARRYVNQLADKFRVLADLLIELGRLTEANDVLQMLKEEEFSDFVKRDAKEIERLKRKVRLTAKERQLIDRYLLLAQKAAEVGEQYRQLEDKKQKQALSTAEEQQRKDLSAQVADVNAAFKLFLEKELINEIGTDGARVIKADRDLQSKVREWGVGTVALYTVVTENRYRIVMTTPTVQIDAKTNITAAALNKKIFAFRKALQDVDVDPRPLGKELYDILIKPIEKDLAAAGATTLVWSLDGTLRYIPVAALSPDGKTYLVERYQNITITPRTRERVTTQISNWTALGMGVSEEQTVIYPDQPGKKEKVEALPGTKTELLSIIRDEDHPNEEGILPGKRYLDADFTLKNMTDSLAKKGKDGQRKFNIVHLASHFHLGTDWSNSYLFLGNSKFLTLEDLTETTAIDFAGVDLVTLSACDTALGTASNGMEVDSLAEAIQAKSGQAVLATLWEVSDMNTPQLMSSFYRSRKENTGMTKAEALRQAQLAMLNSKPQAGGFSLAHPNFWSGFVLIGNWR